jgi:hypothetical protein
MVRRFLAVAAVSAAALIVSPAAGAESCTYSVGGYMLSCTPTAGAGSTDSYGTGSYGTGSYGTGSYGTGSETDSYGTGASTDSYGTGSDNT